jgi:hydroxymethylbilane synthase
MKDLPAELAPGPILAAVSTRGPARRLGFQSLRDAGRSAAARGGRHLEPAPRGLAAPFAPRPAHRALAWQSGYASAQARRRSVRRHRAGPAGLKRLAQPRITEHLPVDRCLPAVAQGVLAIETRADDAATQALVRAALHDAREEPRIVAERAFLARMGGSCQTPLAAHATWAGDQLALAALCGTPDGTRVLRAEARGSAGDAVALGEAAADRLLADGAAAIVAACSAAAHP